MFQYFNETLLFFSTSAVTCGNPGIPEHAIISSYDFRVGSNVVFTCEEGYELEEECSQTCQFNSQSATAAWMGTSPICQRK